MDSQAQQSALLEPTAVDSAAGTPMNVSWRLIWETALPPVVVPPIRPTEEVRKE